MTLLRSLALSGVQSVAVFIVGLGLVAPRLVPDAQRLFAPSLGLVLFIAAAAAFGAGCWCGGAASGRRSEAGVSWAGTPTA